MICQHSGAVVLIRKVLEPNLQAEIMEINQEKIAAENFLKDGKLQNELEEGPIAKALNKPMTPMETFKEAMQI